jgi:hypothetical protein
LGEKMEKEKRNEKLNGAKKRAEIRKIKVKG